MREPPEMLRVLIAEDDYLVREGARSVLGSHPEIEVLGAAGDAEELLELLKATKPDVVITDIRMPPSHRTEGIQLAQRIRAEHPEIGVVVLSQHADAEYALELLRQGSAGLAYLLKERLGDVDKLVATIKEVADGGSVLDPTIVDGLLSAQRGRTRSRVHGLTERESEVLQMMASGRSNAGIARALVLTEGAVEKHINSIFRKLGLSADVELNHRVAAVLFYLQREV